MSERTSPMLRGSAHGNPSMDLPAGRTCADCSHFQRCNAMFGHIAADEVCDWSPSRFHQRDAVGLATRLEALMLRCREDAHTPTYADLLAVKGNA